MTTHFKLKVLKEIIPWGLLMYIKLEMTLQFDQTVEKEALKYHALMLFTAYYEEIVQVDEKQNQTQNKNTAKQFRKSSRQPLSLVKKTYVVKDFDSKN